MRHIGTNGLPTLLRMLRREDTPAKLKAIAFAEKHGFITTEMPRKTYSPNAKKYHYLTVARAHAWAGAGFRFLGPDASNALPDLVEIYRTATNCYSKYSALISIANIGPPAIPALPLAVSAVTDTNTYIQSAGLYCLGTMRAEPSMVIPLLISKLTNGSEYIGTRVAAVYSLGYFGPQAKATSPVLVGMLEGERLLDPQHSLSSNQTQFFKKYIEDVLKAIDPEAAAKVLVDKESTAK